MTNLVEVTLKVSEGLSKDVGRGIARLDPKDMAKLEIKTGDVIRIQGKRFTAAKVVPAYTSDRGQGIVQIDGITRFNAHVSLDEHVKVCSVQGQPAYKVELRTVGLGASFPGANTNLMKLLEGLPIVPGDRVRANLWGSKWQNFEVVDTGVDHNQVVILTAETELFIQEGNTDKSPQHRRITYEDVGGLGKSLQRIREMIELPLKCPELFQQLGIDPPRGVLLYGPPGCGKTLIARAVASETDAFFIAINGPEIMHKFYGESEAHLRSIFEKARENAPAIVFLDEIDAVAPRRTEVKGEVEKRVVAQFLALMDGLESRGQVVVIGATNVPDELDPALRRPGRFDREIAITIPDRVGRRQILDIYTRGMPLANDVDLERLAEITHGYVGADLEALCREAAMLTLREFLPCLDLKDPLIHPDILSQLQVTMDHFIGAMKEIEPSAIREVFTEIPSVKWEDVGGMERVKSILQEAVELPLKHEAVLAKAGARTPKGILLAGPPGTGKTLLARAVATESEVNFISVKGPALMSKYVGESERAIREVFKKARQASPCVLFFDEIDSLVPRRGSGQDSHVTDRVISQFLTELDGIEELKGVIVLGATNRPDIMDPALLRAGRFDMVIHLPVPDEANRLAIWQVHCKDKPLASKVEFSELVKASQGWTGAEIEAVCQKAALLAVRDHIHQPHKNLCISPHHLATGLTEIKESLQTRA